MKNTRLHANWDRLGPVEMERLQMANLRRYLRDVVQPFSPYYNTRIDRKLIPALRRYSDLEQLPFTSKRNLLNSTDHPERTRELVLSPREEILRRRPATFLRALLRGRATVAQDLAREFRPVLMTSTTGRSSDPVPFLYSAHDLDILSAAGRRLMEIGDSRVEWKHLNLFPYAPHLAFWQAHHASLGFGTFCLSTGGGKVMGTDGNVRMLGKIKPEVIIGMPTFIYHVLQKSVEEDIEITGLRRIVLGGEKVPDGIRRKLKALAARLGSGKVDVIATYGFTEAKMAFPECPFPGHDQPSGYHLYPDFGIVEVIDPETGRQVPDGTPGEIVFTPLDSRGSVVLRYRTGDIIEGGIVRDPCPHCGRLVPRLVGKISRVSDHRRMQLGKIKGTLVDFNELEHLLDNCPSVGQWLIELRKLHGDPLEVDELIVHAESHSEASSRREIVRALTSAAEISPNAILFHSPAEMRKLQGVGQLLKEQKVIDNRPAAATRPEGSNERETHEHQV
jgi:phenylacetate-coenzyme A ligase PaaK-like adenylate-forming protein